MTTTVQLRRYTVEPDRLAEFVAWFPGIVPVRDASPERAAAFETFPRVVTHQLNVFVRPALPTTG